MSASLSRLQSFYGELKAPLLLHAVIKREFPGTIALVTSFASDAGLLLAMACEIDPAIPVLFLNTGRHPPETLAYARDLPAHLGLTRVEWITPGAESEPFSSALETLGFLALITGNTDVGRPRIELDGSGVFRIHPLAGWPQEEQKREMQRRGIPSHPLGPEGGLESLALARLMPDADYTTPMTAMDWSL